MECRHDELRAPPRGSRGGHAPRGKPRRSKQTAKARTTSFPRLTRTTRLTERTMTIRRGTCIYLSRHRPSTRGVATQLRRPSSLRCGRGQHLPRRRCHCDRRVPFRMRRAAAHRVRLLPMGPPLPRCLTCAPWLQPPHPSSRRTGGSCRRVGH